MIDAKNIIKKGYKNRDILQNFQFDVDFSSYVTFKASGYVSALFVPNNLEELVDVLKFLKYSEIDFFIIGKGSNLLITPKGYDGVAIKLSEFNDITFKFNNDDICYLTCGAYSSLSSLGRKSFEHSLSGLESLSLIPGTVGGGVFMNAGAYGIEMKDIVDSVLVLNTETYEVEELENSKCQFDYRSSIFMDKKYIILGCTLILKIAEDKNDILSLNNEYKDKRNKMQPLDKPSAGSTFKRPENDFAGRLIEVSGLKGYKVGGAMVSEKHAGFVVNYMEATAEDILKCINDVKECVFEKTGVALFEEVQIIGKR